MRITPARWILGLVAVFALLGGFVGGYGYARWAPATLPAAQPPEPTPASTAAQANDFALLSEMRGLIQSEFYRPANADSQNLLHGAARGMVQALGDPNSVYEPPVERELGDSRWPGRAGRHPNRGRGPRGGRPRPGRALAERPDHAGPRAAGHHRHADRPPRGRPGAARGPDRPRRDPLGLRPRPHARQWPRRVAHQPVHHRDPGRSARRPGRTARRAPGGPAARLARQWRRLARAGRPGHRVLP